jgi:putative transposase
VLHKKYLVNWEGAPPYRPDLRSVSERPFLTVAQRWEPFVPGVVDKEDFGRGHKHPAIFAAMTLPEFRECVVRAVLAHNASVVRGFSCPTGMVERGLPATPNEIWAYGTGINPCGSVRDLGQLRVDLMPGAPAVLTESGIEFANSIYVPPRRDLTDFQAYARVHGQLDGLDVRFDSNDTEQITLVTREGVYDCPLSKRSSPELGTASLLEQVQYLERKLSNNAKGQNDSQSFRVREQLNTERRGVLAAQQTKRAVKEAGLEHVDYQNIGESNSQERLLSGIAEMLRQNSDHGAIESVVPKSVGANSPAEGKYSSNAQKQHHKNENSMDAESPASKSGPKRRKRFWELEEERAMRILSEKK